MDAELQDIFDLCCETGFQAIVDEADWQMRADPDSRDTFIEGLSALPNHYHRAMTTFLNHGECWKGATRFHHADSLSYWRKRKNMDQRPAAVDDDSLQALADQIRHYFRRTEGRGENCVVEPFRRGDLDYFFAYPEDYSQESIEWVDGKFGRRPHNPAFEVIFVYSQKDGTLDLNFRGARKAVEPLQWMFANAILKFDELPRDPMDDRVYDLTPIARRDFDFVYSVGSGIEDVVVRHLRLTSRFKKGDRITLEADGAKNPEAVYDLLETIRSVVPLHLYNVTLVELAAKVVAEAGRPPKTVSFRLTHPNSCSLKYDEVGARLRAMLEASGIEPKQPAASENAEVLAPA